MPIEGPRVYGTPATFFLLLDGLRRFRSLPYLRYIDTNVMRILGRLIMATKLRLEWTRSGGLRANYQRAHQRVCVHIQRTRNHLRHGWDR